MRKTITTKKTKPKPHRSTAYAIIPIFILNDENLPDGCKLLYLQLSTYESKAEWPSIPELADIMNVSPMIIEKWIHQLCEENYIFWNKEII